MTQVEYNEFVEKCAEHPETEVVLWISKGKGLLVGKNKDGFKLTQALDNPRDFIHVVDGVRYGEYIEIKGELKTTQQLCNFTGLSPNFISQLVTDGIIKPVVTGHKGKPAQFDATAIEAIDTYMTEKGI